MFAIICVIEGLGVSKELISPKGWEPPSFGVEEDTKPLLGMVDHIWKYGIVNDVGKPCMVVGLS